MSAEIIRRSAGGLTYPPISHKTPAWHRAKFDNRYDCVPRMVWLIRTPKNPKPYVLGPIHSFTGARYMLKRKGKIIIQTNSLTRAKKWKALLP